MTVDDDGEWEIVEEVYVDTVLVNFLPWEHFSRMNAIQPVAAEPFSVVMLNSVADTAFDDNGRPALAVISDSLLSSRPVMKFGNQVFEGTWDSDSHCAQRCATNLAVVHLERNAMDASSAKSKEAPKKRGRSAGTAGAAVAPVVSPSVAGLLEHLPGGVDHDTAATRVRLEKEAEGAKWSMKEISAPAAVLRMKRVH